MFIELLSEVSLIVTMAVLFLIKLPVIWLLYFAAYDDQVPDLKHIRELDFSDMLVAELDQFLSLLLDGDFNHVIELHLDRGESVDLRRHSWLDADFALGEVETLLDPVMKPNEYLVLHVLEILHE